MLLPYHNKWTGTTILNCMDEETRYHIYHDAQIHLWHQNYLTKLHVPEDIWALYNFCRESLEKLYPGCIYPVPMDEVDADVMRAFSDMQERYRNNLSNE